MRIEINCPECGGSSLWTEEQRLHNCPFCGSLLYFDKSPEDRFWIEPKIHTPEQLKEVVVLWKAIRKRAEDKAVMAPQNEQQLDFREVITVPLEPYINRIRSGIFLDLAVLILVPYWHCRGTVYFNLLVESGPRKSYVFRRVLLDEALPAYDPSLWNFRDRGLRLGKANLKPATSAVLSKVPHIEFRKEPASDLGRLARPPVDDPGAALRFRDHRFCHIEKLAVFRPYWITSLQYDGRKEILLVDASFETVAGYPSEEEAFRLLGYDNKPYHQQKTIAIRPITSRCPVCGWDLKWKVNENIHFCSNCGRALLLGAGEIIDYPYLFVSPEELHFIFIPFWKFQVRLKLRNRTYESLSDYYKTLFVERLIKSFQYHNCLYIPACSIKKNTEGDRLFVALTAEACCRLHQWKEGPIQPGPQIVPGQLTMESAKEALQAALPLSSYIPPEMQKLGSLNQMMKETEIHVRNSSLVLIPFARKENSLVVGNQSFSLQLLNALPE